mgnify:CR=1 FL=1|tara:strand:- start:34 stop:609 length:576 start_codon:yes stop_codon:yes gene_type:complete
MYSTNYIKDFYDNIKANQQELINNHNSSCQKGGYSILNNQLQQIGIQTDKNNIRLSLQQDLNNKISNIMKNIQVGGGKTLGDNIKLLNKLIKQQCSLEKKLLRNITKQQKCIKQGKIEYLSKYQSNFKVDFKKANEYNKSIKKLQNHINKIIKRKDTKIKANDGQKLLEKRRQVRVHTLNNLKSMINNIKK